MSRRGSGFVVVLVSLLVACSTLAFGAVYAWAYLPLFLAAACIGAGAIAHRRGIHPDLHRLSFAGLIVALAIAIQLLPLSRGVLAVISPATPTIVDRYSLAGEDAGRHALSLDPAATAKGLAVVLVLGIYTVGLAGILTRKRARALVQGIAVFAAPLALAGLYGREHSNGLVFGFWQPVESVIADSFGPFVNRNHFAGWMLLAVGLTLGLWCGRSERALKRLPTEARRRIVWLSTSDASMIVLTAVAVVMMSIALVWTLSRSGIVSLGVALTCFAALIFRRHAVGRTTRAVAVAFLGLVLLAGVGWRGFDRLVDWFSDSRDFVGRLDAWKDGWQVIRDFPVAGTGINTYPVAMIFYQRHHMQLRMSHAHNDYLQLLAEGGLLVAIPLAVAIVVFALTVLRTVSRLGDDSEGYWIRAGACVGLLGIAVQELADFSLHIPANMFLFATAAAIALFPRSDPPSHTVR